ncbi:hypothetical protein SSP24_38560 [Streptomyces spinoverrucosus]|uniref:Uncharacterized protein n=1 Tax=Streptomyces spinoverrucosus TaxID=284043 RepID=A0A4Y3VKE8_9ACTN|nr:hypothetical protein SSP24_38560 [Streptomyces spinoverrucosus]GHB75345.1 hypothetical protein GCM10010397_52130 [Streptomyces spinoverrucosus]
MVRGPRPGSRAGLVLLGEACSGLAGVVPGAVVAEAVPAVIPVPPHPVSARSRARPAAGIPRRRVDEAMIVRLTEMCEELVSAGLRTRTFRSVRRVTHIANCPSCSDHSVNVHLALMLETDADALSGAYRYRLGREVLK